MIPTNFSLVSVVLNLILYSWLQQQTNLGMYVSDQRNYQVTIFMADGVTEKSLCEGKLNASALMINNDGNLVVADDSNQRIRVFTPTGEELPVRKPFIQYWEGICGIIQDFDGNYYMTDAHNSRVIRGTPKGEWTNIGPEYEIDGPAPIGFNPLNGNLIIGDTYNHRCQIWNSDGELLSTFGIHGLQGQGCFHYPNGIVVDRNGVIVVCDQGNRVQFFSSEGKFIKALETMPDEDGRFNVAMGLSIDKEGNLIIPDFRNERIQIFCDAKTEFPLPAGSLLWSYNKLAELYPKTTRGPTKNGVILPF